MDINAITELANKNIRKVAVHGVIQEWETRYIVEAIEEGGFMRFGKDHKVIIDSMNKTEAKAFVKFLKSEVVRHQEDITQADELMKYVKEKFGVWK